MTELNELISYFEKSISDNWMSKAEKRALKAAVADLEPNKHDLDWMRSKVFDIARKHISGGKNDEVLEWLEGANKILLPKATITKSETKAFFSPGNDCLNAVCNQISYSTNSIDVCVFTISDNRIKDKLLYAWQKGVKIRIITDNDKSFDKGSDVHELANAGIAVKIDNSDNHMHHKFAVFDKKVLLTGSYNWTRSASEYNQENVLITSYLQVVEQYNAAFEKLWTGTITLHE
jgi:cardiolipin hydrolase